ncbi:MAG: helix-turn-helix domain-containing protein [Spirochaetota bacterium]
MPHLNRAYAPHMQNASIVSVRKVWEVEAGDTYHGLHETGFPTDGLFVSFQGTGVVRIGHPGTQRLYSIDAPQFMFVPHGVPCSYWTQGGVTWKFFFLEFDTVETLPALGLTYSLPYDLPEPGPVLRNCRDMIRELREHSPEADVAAACEFTRLLVDLARMQKRLKPLGPLIPERLPAAETDQTIGHLLAWMEQHVEGRYVISDFVSVSGLSRRQLYRRFHAVTDVSPKQYFMALRIQAASRRLQQTSETIASVAERYGFADVYHFSRSFSRYIGCPPSAFRNSSLCTHSRPCIARNRVGVTPSERRKTVPK